MKSLVRHLVLIILGSLIFSSSQAQKASYTTNGGMTLGFGLGKAYQKSDIANSTGTGFDITLGHHLGKREGAFLSPDWKFRLLMGENRAHDHRINGDGTYSNVRYNFYNYDLELGLTLNRLRERTRIVVSGFGGAGITQGRTFTDLFDADGLPYDYSLIDPGQKPSYVSADLLELSDGDYETVLDNRAAVLPTLGFYVGYQFTRSFSLGFEHKVNYSLSETNNTFGINIDNKIVSGSGVDRNRYTSLVFRWSLGGGGAGRAVRSPGQSVYSSGIRTNRISPVTQPPVTEVITDRPVSTTSPAVTRTTPVANPHNSSSKPAASALPTVTFINPPADITVENNVFSISAGSANVREWHDVTVKVNGTSTSNFSFSREGVVATNVGLTAGANVIEITGKNESGVASVRTTITYSRPARVTTQVAVAVNPPVADPPVVVPPPVVEPPPVVVPSPVVDPPVVVPQPVVVQPPVVVSTPVVDPPVVVQPPVVVPTPVVDPPVVVPPPVVEPPPVVVSPPVVEPPPVVVPPPVVDLPVVVPPPVVEPPPVVVPPPVVDPPVVVSPPVVVPPPVVDTAIIVVPPVVVPPPVEDKPCGIRINPGNSAWQFCLIGPAVSFNRDSLKNDTFSYAGPATSLFFMPTGGGGEALINGKPYTVRSGQHYLFTGKLKVTVSTKNPGSMGQWSVCVESDTPPISGTGNKRPKSPCEQ